MKKATLRTPNPWTPIDKADAKLLGLKVQPFKAGEAKDFGLVLDRSVWVEAPLSSRLPWMVAFRLVNEDGQPVIAEVRVFPDQSSAPYKAGPPGTLPTRWRRPAGRWSGDYPGVMAHVPRGGITARVLRTIRMQSYKGLLRTILTQHAEAFRSMDLGVPLSTVPSSTTRGRKGRSDETLARIAEVYGHAYRANRPSTAAVAKAFRLSLSQARDAVRRARVRGLLSPASKQGKGGGLLTPLAQKILKQVLKSKGGKQHGTKR
jgi:hypothetical protein